MKFFVLTVSLLFLVPSAFPTDITDILLPPVSCRPHAVELDSILPKAEIDYSSLTVSGLSSGATMAMQYHFAHSAEVVGAGMFAGIPYGTFYNNTPSPIGFLRILTGPIPFVPIPVSPVPNSVLVAQADYFAENDWIDKTSNLTESRVYIFHGKLDMLVNHDYGVRSAAIYKHYGANLKTKLDMDASHRIPTDNYPTKVNNCGHSSSFDGGMNNCGYEGIFDMFSHFYGVNYKAPESSSVKYTGTFSAFDQNPFTESTEDGKSDFMANKGYLYIPKYCEKKNHTCKIHIALHGCFQNVYNDFVCNFFATKSGYLPVGDANNVVIIFPQAAHLDVNLRGDSNIACWDFFAGVSDNFCLKEGPQIKAIRRILQAVAKKN